MLYIAGDIHPSNYYRIEGYPSYEPVRILANSLRKEGIKEAQEELKPKAQVKSVKEGEGKKGEEKGKDNENKRKKK